MIGESLLLGNVGRSLQFQLCETGRMCLPCDGLLYKATTTCLDYILYLGLDNYEYKLPTTLTE